MAIQPDPAWQYPGQGQGQAAFGQHPRSQSQLQAVQMQQQQHQQKHQPQHQQQQQQQLGQARPLRPPHPMKSYSEEMMYFNHNHGPNQNQGIAHALGQNQIQGQNSELDIKPNIQHNPYSHPISRHFPQPNAGPGSFDPFAMNSSIGMGMGTSMGMGMSKGDNAIASGSGSGSASAAGSGSGSLQAAGGRTGTSVPTRTSTGSGLGSGSGSGSRSGNGSGAGAGGGASTTNVVGAGSGPSAGPGPSNSTGLGNSATSTTANASASASANASASGPGEGNKKRRHNVGKACENCRRRRVKCDGVQPFCGTCKVYNDECSWNPREDYRKPLSRQQVEALRTRVADLERMLRDHGLDPGTGNEGSAVEQVAGGGAGGTIGGTGGRNDGVGGSGGGEGGRPDETRGERGVGADKPMLEGPEDLRDWSQSHLVEHESGDFQVYGPTSAFRHLGRQHASTTGSSNEANPDSSPPAFGGGGGPGSPFWNDFRRYLPREVSLTEDQHEAALDRFFRYYAPWGQRTHPILFREDMALALSSETPIKTPHYSPMLHNAILAIGLCYCDEPHLRTPALRKVFVTEAKKHLETEGMNPSVATVQALAHLASGHSVDAEHNLGWLYIGMALRCALALGLNMDNTPMLKNGKITETQARERNVTYWTAFIQEGLWAPYIGRPVYVPDCTTPAPTVDEQLDNLIWIPHDIPGRVVELSLKPQPSMVSSTFVETVKLMDIGARIMNTLYGIKTDIATLTRSGVISEISLALSTWLEKLPPTLVLNSHSAKHALPHILMMHLSWAWLVILLHRPFYRPFAGLPGKDTKSPNSAGYNAALAVKHCDRAAIQIVALLQTWHRLHDLRFTPPTALQCCFVAGTTHLLSFATSRTEKKKTDALNRAQDCIRLMSYMAVSWPAAQQKQKFLEDLLVEYGMTAKTRSGGNTPTEMAMRKEARVQPPVVVKIEPQTMPAMHQSSAPSAPMQMPTFPQQQQDPPMMTNFNNMSQSSSYIDPILAVQHMSMSSNNPVNMFQPTPQQQQQPPQYSGGNVGQSMNSQSMLQPNQPMSAVNQSYVPINDFDMQFGSFDYSLPPSDNQPLEADWDPNNFVIPDIPAQRYTQALFDHIMQPHTQLGVHSQQPPVGR